MFSELLFDNPILQLTESLFTRYNFVFFPQSIVFISGVLGCLFYERFIEEPDETGKRDPLITRLMMKYIMADPDVDREKRENHMRHVKEKMDIFQEMKRKPRLGKQPFDIEKIERDKPTFKPFGPDGY